MKLTESDIAAIEDVITTFCECGQRASVIKHNLRDIQALSSFLCVLRSVGIALPKRRSPHLSPEEALAFREFLRTKVAAQ